MKMIVNLFSNWYTTPAVLKSCSILQLIISILLSWENSAATKYVILQYIKPSSLSCLYSAHNCEWRRRPLEKLTGYIKMRPIILREFHLLEHTLCNRELLSEKAFLISGAQVSASSVAAQICTSDTGQWHSTAYWLSLRKSKSNSFKWRCGWTTSVCRKPISLIFISLEGFP